MSTNTYVDPDFDIEKPLLKDNKWIVFSDAIFSHLDTIDCNDTVEGICYYNKTFDECVKFCDYSSNCEYGYYLTNDNTNICVPIRDLKMHSNPIYRLRKKDIYPELKNTNTKTFINREVHRFPPVEANIVFYQDNLVIQNVETSTKLEKSYTLEDYKINEIKFSEFGKCIIQPVQIPSNFSADKYIPLKYGDIFALNIPNTNIVILEESLNNEKLQWGYTSFIYPNNKTFYLESLSGKMKGDNVQYSDIFNIRTTTENKKDISKYLGLSSSYILEKQIISNNSTFRFIPKMIGFYCNNDSVCTPTPLEEMVIDEKGIGTVDGLHIGRNPGCWGVCKYKIKNQPKLEPLSEYKEKITLYNKEYIGLFFLIILLIGILIIIIFIIKKILI